MKRGDKVRLTYKPEVTGEITEIEWTSSLICDSLVTVKYDDQTLIPNQDTHPESEVMMLGYKLPIGELKNKCECGQEDSKWIKHSDYCPLYSRYV